MRPRSSIIAALFATIVVTPPSWGQTPAAPALNAKVQETLMGAYGGALMYMSADGEHVGMAAPKGSRRVVLIDGVEGPVFDEIPQFIFAAQVPIYFSATGGHHAYVGRRGGDFIAVVDGKEAGTLFTSQTQQSVSYSSNQGWKFWFNDDGSRLAYAGLAPAGGGFVMDVDGVKGPIYRAIDFRQTMMNRKRFIYVAQTADQKWQAVVDGKPGPSYAAITSLTVTPDGAHYAYIASQQNATGPTTAVVIDGVAGTFYFGVGDLELAPDGRVAYVATTNRGDGDRRGGEAILVVDGAITMRVSGATPIALQFANTIRPSFRSPNHRIAWSPDGKGFAIIKPNSPNPGVAVMVNGKPSGQTYLTADELLWSADGSRFAYLGSSQTGTFAIVDGQELPFSNISELQFSPDGKRYAFRAGQGGSSVVVDGKEVSKAILPINGSLRFSSNSKHVAYGAQTSTGNAQAFLDGVAKPTFLGNFVSQTLVQPALNFPEVFFSPDGNRIAYAGRTQSATAPSAVFVDDVSYELRGQSFTFPSFSPDSKRFAVFTSAGQGLALMIDGKVLATNYTYLLPLQPTAARFTDNNTFRFYGIKDNQIYRVVVGL
jgi:WD40 repeat protein